MLALRPMPNLRSSIKDVIKARKNRVQNLTILTRLKTVSRAVEQAESAEKAKTALLTAQSAWDRAVSQGVVHKNTASRKKSRLSHFVAKRWTAPKN